MVHYSEFEATKARQAELQEKIRRGQIATVTKCEDFIDRQNAAIVDLLNWDFESGESVFPNNLKETDGKPEGARYCYLRDIVLAANKSYLLPLASEIEAVVNSVTENNYMAAMSANRAALKLISGMDKDFLKNLVGVRAHAINSGKYELYGYRQKIPLWTLLDALARHMLKILFISDIDEESGFHHFGHMSANLVMIDAQLRLHHGCPNA